MTLSKIRNKSQGYKIDEDIESLEWLEETNEYGNMYTGTVNKTGQRHGYGRAISAGGEIYEA